MTVYKIEQNKASKLNKKIDSENQFLLRDINIVLDNIYSLYKKSRSSEDELIVKKDLMNQEFYNEIEINKLLSKVCLFSLSDFVYEYQKEYVTQTIYHAILVMWQNVLIRSNLIIEKYGDSILKEYSDILEQIYRNSREMLKNYVSADTFQHLHTIEVNYENIDDKKLFDNIEFNKTFIHDFWCVYQKFEQLNKTIYIAEVKK
jgi:hypothetical protein